MRIEIKNYLTDLISKWKSLSIPFKIALSGILGGLILCCFVVLIYVLVGIGFFGRLPSKVEILNITNPVASNIFAKEGELLGSYYTENREYITPNELNPFFIKALISSEDHRFYSHKGVDFRSLGRVLIKSILLRRKESGGGSTITQQLVKNLFPRQDFWIASTVINKFREFHIARQIENHYNKDEILWLYSSTVPFGEQTYGLKSASKKYFNKTPEELKLEEAAMLVGLLKATTYYNPRRFPHRAKERRNEVLMKMVKTGLYHFDSIKPLLEKEVNLDFQFVGNQSNVGLYFKEFVKNEFSDISDTLRKLDGSLYNLYQDGLKIYTTLDYTLQANAAELKKRHMTKLQKIFEDSWKGKNMFGSNHSIIDDYILKDQEYLFWRKKGYDVQSSIDSFNISIERKYWNWDNVQVKKSTKIDSIKHFLKLLHASILAVDVQSGNILVYEAGNDYFSFPFDNITAKRQAGSLFKPIVYLSALESGIEPCDYYKNELITYSKYDDWQPENADHKYGGYCSVNNALAHSINTISVQLLFKTGLEKVMETARSLGITSEIDKVPSIVLGTSDVSLLEMVRAYSRIISNKETGLHSILRIEDKNGRVIYERDASEDFETIQFSDSSIEKLKSMMFKVSTDGTARKIYSQYSIPSTVYSKTGTTQNQSDGWFIAGTENIVCGAWVGTLDRRMHFPSLSYGSASATALPLVGELLENCYKNVEFAANFYKPIIYECPDELTDEQYAYQLEQEKLDSLYQDRSQYGGWLGKLFRKKSQRKTLSQKYSDHQIKKQIEVLKKNRQIEIDKLDREIEEWQQMLDNNGGG